MKINISVYATPPFHSREGHFERYLLKMSKQKIFVRSTEMAALSEQPTNLLPLMSALLIHHLFNMLNVKSSNLIFSDEVLHFYDELILEIDEFL